MRTMISFFLVLDFFCSGVKYSSLPFSVLVFGGTDSTSFITIATLRSWCKATDIHWT